MTWVFRLVKFSLTGFFAPNVFNTLRYRHIDKLIASARVDYEWRALELAINEIEKLDVGDSYSGRYGVQLNIKGWSRNFHSLKNTLKSLQTDYSFTFKINRVIRKDVKKSEGIKFLFNGFELRVDLSLLDNSYIDKSKKLADDLSISLGQTYPRKILKKSVSKPIGFVDSINFQMANLNSAELSVVGYLIENPRNAIYLLEAINNKNLSQRIFEFIDEIGFDFFFQSIGIKHQILAKLMLICNFNYSIQNLKKLNIEFVKLNEANNLESSFLEMNSKRINRRIASFQAQEYFSDLRASFGQLNNVSVQSNGRILNSKTLFIYDRSDDPRLTDVAGNQFIEFGSISDLNHAYTVLSHVTRHIEEGIHLISRRNDNWFHWLIETLPRLLLLPEDINKEVPLIISSSISSTAMESLKLLTERELFEVGENEVLEVNKLYLPGPAVYHPDSSEMNWDKRTGVNQAVLKSLRQLILSKLQIEPVKRHNIFFGRYSPYRKLINIKQIEKILTNDYDFQSINPDQLNFQEQVKLFSQTRTVIIPGGAAMANFIFLPENAKTLVLVSDLLRGYEMPAALASVANARCSVVLGPHLGSSPQVFSRHDLFHSDYFIDPDVLRDHLNFIISS